jgi:SET domain-containing protein
LHGEQGLFAIKKFEKFDVIGEYTGRVVGEEILRGHYLATLEDLPQTDSLGVDAEHCGNEIRFINSYLNIAFVPNVTMRTTYINTYPHLVVVCTREIDIDEEILLDYGEAYNKEFLTPKTTALSTKITEEQTARLFASLPRIGIAEDCEDNEDVQSHDSDRCGNDL